MWDCCSKSLLYSFDILRFRPIFRRYDNRITVTLLLFYTMGQRSINPIRIYESGQWIFGSGQRIHGSSSFYISMIIIQSRSHNCKSLETPLSLFRYVNNFISSTMLFLNELFVLLLCWLEIEIASLHKFYKISDGNNKENMYIIEYNYVNQAKLSITWIWKFSYWNVVLAWVIMHMCCKVW